MAVLSSGKLCSPALIHGAPLKEREYMFARPAEPYLAPVDGKLVSQRLLGNAVRTHIVDDQGRHISHERASATSASASATAMASVAQGASVAEPSKRARGAEGEGIPGSADGLQLRAAEEKALREGSFGARASGACLREEAALLQAEAAASGTAELTELPRAPVLAALDDYLALVGNIYYQQPETGTSSSTGDSSFTVLRRTVLGRLRNPLRRPTVLDKWSPYEIALFESAICLVGKDFVALNQIIESKTAQDIMDFFYAWKKTKNYQRWKQTFRPPARA